ncbi:group-specific protein [Tuberibacillus sp. Marseille-P3662]|uniref:group-specific protein n=1 Tax=Tuberibacillus sp. Marseille-P3662 TaxID=1965358 RepID=UPI000A1CB0D7|nr:group-specific protein [Tuberibacillus sp. Marseille-P3662]
MLDIQIDEQEARDLYLEKVEEKVKQIEADLVFWDTAELKRRTCMSWGTIQDQFFFDERFPKFKVGQKWYFPAQEAKDFLIQWIHEKGR